MSDQPTFTIGPPDPVLDSRQLPAVTSDDESGFVTGADLGPDHPDNSGEPGDEEVGLGPVAEASGETSGEGDAEAGPAPAEADLDALVADVDPDDVDQRGFDDADLVEPVTSGDSQPPVAAGGS
jgi:hypothetical protein